MRKFLGCAVVLFAVLSSPTMAGCIRSFNSFVCNDGAGNSYSVDGNTGYQSSQATDRNTGQTKTDTTQYYQGTTTRTIEDNNGRTIQTNSQYNGIPIYNKTQEPVKDAFACDASGCPPQQH
jgi:hypothetical protein